MEYLFDTADLSEIRKYAQYYPITGVTSNPSIIKKCGKIDFFPHFRELREIIGFERTLHIQVTAQDAAGMLAEAERIHKEIDAEVYIKVPVTENGLEAIRLMKRKGFMVTATAIYSKTQALTALEAGSDYLAMYYNRMENLGIDPVDVIETTSMMIENYSYPSKILGASFKNMGQVNKAFEAGADAVTVPPTLLHEALNMPDILKAVDDFEADWQSLFGEKRIYDL